MIKRPILFARRHAVAFLALFVALGGGAQAVLAGIRPNSVGAAQIKRNAVGASEIKAGAVGESELKDGAVDTAKLAKGAVGLDRLGFAWGTTGAVAQGPAITLAPRGCADVAARRVTLTGAGAPTPGETVGWDIDFFVQVQNPTDPGGGRRLRPRSARACCSTDVRSGRAGHRRSARARWRPCPAGSSPT